MKNILVTGGLGFIGFNAIQLWKKMRPQYNYFIVDAETYAAQFKIDQKKKWLEENNVQCFKLDICKQFDVEAIVERHEIDTIVNFAAESHVDNSIASPDEFFQTNVIGTAKLLNIARKYDLRFSQIGTDEVYGETTPNSWIREDGPYLPYTSYFFPSEMPLVPSSPYSSSKASADMIALSYHHTFGTKVTVSRCTNNAGEFQHPEKLIGTVISKALKNEKIPVYGKGNQMRHWIDVNDHNRAIMWILENGILGKVYNVGPDHDNWISNIELIKFILKELKKPESLIEHVADRLGHDSSYYLHSDIPDFKTAKYAEFMPRIVNWYKENL